MYASLGRMVLHIHCKHITELCCQPGTKFYPIVMANVGHIISVSPMAIKALTGVCRILEQIGVMRSHLIYSGTLLNEIDLSCVYSDLIPDLSKPENMKTCSFNYSGQLHFKK